MYKKCRNSCSVCLLDVGKGHWGMQGACSSVWNSDLWLSSTVTDTGKTFALFSFQLIAQLVTILIDWAWGMRGEEVLVVMPVLILEWYQSTVLHVHLQKTTVIDKSQRETMRQTGGKVNWKSLDLKTLLNVKMCPIVWTSSLVINFLVKRSQIKTLLIDSVYFNSHWRF